MKRYAYESVAVQGGGVSLSVPSYRSVWVYMYIHMRLTFSRWLVFGVGDTLVPVHSSIYICVRACVCMYVHGNLVHGNVAGMKHTHIASAHAISDDGDNAIGNGDSYLFVSVLNLHQTISSAQHFCGAASLCCVIARLVSGPLRATEHSRGSTLAAARPRMWR